MKDRINTREHIPQLLPPLSPGGGELVYPAPDIMKLQVAAFPPENSL